MEHRNDEVTFDDATVAKQLKITGIIPDFDRLTNCKHGNSKQLLILISYINVMKSNSSICYLTIQRLVA